MRLKAITPKLPANLITALEESGIRTDADLLFNSGTVMQLYEKLPQGTVTLAELEGYIKRVAEVVSAPMLTGESLLAQEIEQGSTFIPISTGIPQLDQIVNGRYGPKVLEISGDHGTGKTTFALQAVMRHLSTHADHAALWIDTTGDFSVDRLQMFTEVYSQLPASQSAAERLQLSLAFDINTVQEVLNALKDDHALSEHSTKVSCLVIDSITPIFRPLLSVVSSQGHAMMTSFMQQLRWLAETYSMAILVINATSSVLPQNLHPPSNAPRKPALGPSFTYMTDTTLWLSKVPIQTHQLEEADPPGDDRDLIAHTYRAEILRSKYTPSKTRCIFRIQEGLLLNS